MSGHLNGQLKLTVRKSTLVTALNFYLSTYSFIYSFIYLHSLSNLGALKGEF